MARAAAEAAAAERGSSFYAGSGSEGNAYYALHDESGSDLRHHHNAPLAQLIDTCRQLVATSPPTTTPVGLLMRVHA